MSQTLKWKQDWPQAKTNLVRWWNRQGMAIAIIPERHPVPDNLSRPTEPTPALFTGDIEAWWTDPAQRCDRAEYEMATHLYQAEAFPYFDTQIGPGSLGTFLGARPEFDRETVWYWPCIQDPETYGPIRFDPQNNLWWERHMALIDEGLRRANGRYLVGIPDLIENLDTLAALRGNTELLYDLIERPAWVHERQAEINAAYFAAFDLMCAKVKDEDNGNVFSAFKIWGPGKTAKLQCDFSAMISPKMYQEFVAPYLAAQCKWLDYSLYHLDGTTAVQHLDILLEIEDLNAIEWTPQAGLPGGGSPEWFELYRRIKAGGKGVQVIGVEVEEVLPLLEAIGPEGTFILADARPMDEATAQKLLKAVEPYGK